MKITSGRTFGSTSPYLRFFVSIGLAVLSVIVTYWLWPIVKTAPFMFAFAAVSVSTWYGGLGAGFFSGLLAVVGLDFLLIEPIYQVFAQPADIMVFIIFTLVSLLISTLSDQSIRAQKAMADKAAELEKALDERTTLTKKINRDRQEFEIIINTLPGIVYEGVGSFDLGQQEMAFISDFAQDMLGYEAAEWKGKNFWKTIIHPGDWEAAVSKTRLTYEQGWHDPVSIRGFTRSGELLHLESYNRVISDNRPNTIRTCGVVMDVTERKKNEIALANFAIQLNRSNQELEQFAYVASHDLQEPLRMVISYLQLLERRYKDKLDGDAQEFIEFAVDGANRMKSLITDLLSYSRIHRSEEEFQTVDLNQTLEQVKANLALKIQETGAILTADELPTILGNSTQLKSLMQNLIDNAIKYRGDRTPEIHIGQASEEKNWIISVADNGIGIDERFQTRIFSIFQRLHTRDEYPGTGIGLAVCSKVVEKHGGKIWIESTPGKGSRFYFSIPKRKRASDY